MAPAGGPVPSTTAALAEDTVEAKKEESEESDDGTGFGLFDTKRPNSLVTHSIKN